MKIVFGREASTRRRLAQGYHLGMPLDARDTEDLLRALAP
jgi:hypothetical protein